MFTSSIKREIRHFPVVVMEWRKRNIQKSVMHVQSCCFAYSTYCFFDFLVVVAVAASQSPYSFKIIKTIKLILTLTNTRCSDEKKKKAKTFLPSKWLSFLPPLEKGDTKAFNEGQKDYELSIKLKYSHNGKFIITRVVQCKCCGSILSLV